VRYLSLLAITCIAAGLSLPAWTAYQVWDPGAAREQGTLATQLQWQWRQQPAATHTSQPIALVTGKPFAFHDITAGNPFLHLASLRSGGAIYVTTANGTYRYSVSSESVVRYTDVAVLDPVPGHPGQHARRQSITLITCTPVTLNFTPWRVIVTGTLVSGPAGGEPLP
jgi:LPXTG-site transpeptidase (sortase) family protein